jgi:hypothetical protein
MENNIYPSEPKVKVKWENIHFIILSLVIIIVAFLMYKAIDKSISIPKLLTVFGLCIDITGVIIASQRTPFYGTFHDGGQIEMQRQKVENKSFKKGMYIIAIGMLFQTIGTLL